MPGSVVFVALSSWCLPSGHRPGLTRQGLERRGRGQRYPARPWQHHTTPARRHSGTRQALALARGPPGLPGRQGWRPVPAASGHGCCRLARLRAPASAPLAAWRGGNSSAMAAARPASRRRPRPRRRPPAPRRRPRQNRTRPCPAPATAPQPRHPQRTHCLPATADQQRPAAAAVPPSRPAARAGGFSVMPAVLPQALGWPTLRVYPVTACRNACRLPSPRRRPAELPCRIAISLPPFASLIPGN